MQKWNGGSSSNLHGVQYRILKRGLELLEVGGRLVYSTCSLNPVEDEAVVQRMILDAGKENVIIEDASALLPGLNYSKGLTSWKVASKDGNIYSTWDEVEEKHQSQIRPYMFPSSEASSINIQRCLRILPHQQDTGGFFVCVLTKKALCDWESKPKQSKPTVTETLMVKGRVSRSRLRRNLDVIKGSKKIHTFISIQMSLYSKKFQNTTV